MGWSTRYIISTACFRLQDFRESRSRKLDAKTALVGERWKVKLVSIVFNTSFQYTSSWYTLWLTKSVFAVYVNTFVIHLALHMQSQTNLKNV